MTVGPKRHLNVRRTTETDMVAVHQWLSDQARRQTPGSFLCNWKATERAHLDGRMSVFLESATLEPLAYQWGGLLGDGILEVREEMRGQGIGRMFVEHLMALAEEAGEDVLWVECSPRSSIPFWRHMGFEVQDGKDESAYGHRVMPRRLTLPQTGEPVTVTVSWFPEQRKWERETPPLSVQEIKALQLGGDIFLAERAMVFADREGSDVVVQVLVDGSEWLLGKAKHASAVDMGVTRCANGFYLDSLCRLE